MKLLYISLGCILVTAVILCLFLKSNTQPDIQTTAKDTSEFISTNSYSSSSSQSISQTVSTTSTPVLSKATTSTNIETEVDKKPINHISIVPSNSNPPQTSPTPTTTPIKPPPPKNIENTTMTSDIPSPSPNSALEWGVFAGSNAHVINEFSKTVKENPDYLSYFIHWGNGNGALPAFLTDVAAKKDRTLIIFWEASDYTIGGTDQPKYAYRNILAGNWDSYFKSFAEQLEDYPGPIILVPFSELNGNWTPWSGTKNGNSPEEAVEAFRYIHPYFKDISNVKIGWAVNAASVPNTPENQIEKYYPGDEFVDIVGVDGFNDGPPWYSFSEIFDKPLTKLSTFNKPIFIFSFASAEGSDKASWMVDAFFTQMPKYPNLQAWVWFNQNKERNWLVWSDDDSLSVFRRAVAQ